MGVNITNYTDKLIEAYLTEAPDMYGLPTDDELEAEYQAKKAEVARKRAELLPEPAGVFRTTGTSKTLNVFGVLDSRQNSILPPITVQTNNRMIIDYCKDNNIDWLPLY